jgi:hypothetical protein
MHLDEEDIDSAMELLLEVGELCEALGIDLRLPIEDKVDREALATVVQKWLEENFLDA